VIGTQVFETLVDPDRHFEIYNGAVVLGNTAGKLNDVGNLIVSRADVASSSVLTPSITLDSSVNNEATQDRLPDTELLNMRANSELRILGNPTTLTTETIGTFELERSNGINGRHYITLDDGGAGITLTSSDLLRANTGSTLLFRGEGLGSGPAGPGVTNLIFTAAPTAGMVGSGSGTGLNILPYALGDTDPTGLGADFVTYGGNGVRLLTSGEYAASITGGANNVALTGSPAALGADAAILALKIQDGTSVDLGGNTLDVQNAGILSVGTGPNSITNGTVTFGSETEGFLHVLTDMTLLLAAKPRVSSMSSPT
jgi:hypothetical protein